LAEKVPEEPEAPEEPEVPPGRSAASTLGAGLAVGAGCFLYLAYVSFKESQWGLWRKLVFVTAGAAVMGIFSLF
jgi:hypothetical protein